MKQMNADKNRWLVPIFLSVCICVHPPFQACIAGENPALGPRVEITPSDSRPPYTCCLLGLKDGFLYLQLESGELRQEKASGTKSIHFLPPVETAASALPPVPGPRRGDAANRWPGWSQEDGRRMWELDQREANGALTPVEAMELLKLRERAPPQLKKWEATRRRVSAEGGKIDIAAEQRLLRGAAQEEEAGEAIRRLVLAYLLQGYTGPKMKELLQKDAEIIANPEVRKKVAEHIEHLTNWVGLHRQWRKDK